MSRYQLQSGLRRAIFRTLISNGMSLADIGRRWGISKQAVYNAVYHERKVARNRAEYAIRKGTLARKEHCEHCLRHERYVGQIEMHHADYSKPLEVTFLCRPCHRAAHRRRA